MTPRLSQTRLANWLHGASLDPSNQDLDSHFERMEAIVRALRENNVLDVVAYAYQLSSAGMEGFNLVHDAVVQETEEDWDVSAGDVLPRRLAAAAVADLLDQGDSDVAVIAGLAVHSAEFCGYQAPLADLPSLASGAISRISTERRRRSDEAPPSLYNDVEPQIAKANVEEVEPVGSGPLRAALEKVRASVRRTARRIDAMQIQLENRNHVIDEELDVLWWSHGKQSEVLGLSWREAEGAALLVAPYELASKLALEPPPRSASFLVAAVFEQAGLDPNGSVALREAVECAAPLGTNVSESGGPYKLFPISDALLERHRKNGQDVWADAFKAEFGLDPEEAFPRIDMAGQFLTELSLRKIVRRHANES
jgi:hypothetical protein